MPDQTPTSIVPPSVPLLYSIPDLELFFEFLGGTRFTVAYFTLDSTGVYPAKGSGCQHRTVHEIVAGLVRGSTLHTTLNETDWKGRKRANIVSARVLCVDIDTPRPAYEIKRIIKKYGVHLVVESSPEKYHLYWKIDASSGIDLDTWVRYQLALGHRFGGDLTLNEITKTIRVPGIPRSLKGESGDGELFVPRIVYYAGEGTVIPLTRMDLVGVFPWADKEYERGLKTKREYYASLLKSARTITHQLSKNGSNGNGHEGNGHHPVIETRDFGRNASLYFLLKKHASAIVYDDNGALLDPHNIDSLGLVAHEINSAFESPLEKDEVARVVGKALEKGLGVRERVLLRNQTAVKLLNSVDSGSSGAGGDSGSGDGDGDGGDDGGSGGDAGVFEYDYDADPSLQLNRFTDTAVVARVLQRFGSSLVRVGKHLYAFDDQGKIWKPQDRQLCAEVYSYTHECLFDTVHDPRFIPDLCMNDDGEISITKVRKNQEKFQSLSMEGRVVTGILQSNKVRSDSFSIFDAHPTKYYCANGVIDLADSGDSAGLRDAVSTDYLLARSGVAWVPRNIPVEVRGWDRFLSEIFDWNESPEEMKRFTQELFGYSLSGLMNEQKIFCHYGSGANGKSKLLYALQVISGSYGTLIDPDELTRGGTGKSASKSTSMSNKTFERFGSKIEGKHIAIIDDLEVATVWNEAFVKGVTANRIRARAEYEQSRDIVNRAKLHLGLNEAPTPQTENIGILRRLCLIPYPRTFTADAVVSTELDEMIEREAEGILRWAVDGFLRIYERGCIEYPQDTILATQEYQAEHFTTDRLIHEMFGGAEEIQKAIAREDPRVVWLPSTTLLEDARLYAELSGITGGITELSPVAFGRSMSACLKQKSSRVQKEGDSRVRGFYVLLKYDPKRLKEENLIIRVS